MSNAGERGPLDDPEIRPAFGPGSVRKRKEEERKCHLIINNSYKALFSNQS